ncbi:MAG: MBL fold metallo-hydrolase [Clostridia bacterium]
MKRPTKYNSRSGGYNKALTNAVAENGTNIEYIIITHGHSDHICGVNEHKEEFPNAKVVAYKTRAYALSPDRGRA